MVLLKKEENNQKQTIKKKKINLQTTDILVCVTIA